MVKNLLASAGDVRDMGLIPGLGRYSGVGNGNTLQYSCLGSPMDRGAWWAPVHGVSKVSDTTEHTCNGQLASIMFQVCSKIEIAKSREFIIYLRFELANIKQALLCFYLQCQGRKEAF